MVSTADIEKLVMDLVEASKNTEHQECFEELDTMLENTGLLMYLQAPLQTFGELKSKGLTRDDAVKWCNAIKTIVSQHPTAKDVLDSTIYNIIMNPGMTVLKIVYDNEFVKEVPVPTEEVPPSVQEPVVKKKPGRPKAVPQQGNVVAKKIVAKPPKVKVVKEVVETLVVPIIEEKQQKGEVIEQSRDDTESVDSGDNNRLHAHLEDLGFQVANLQSQNAALHKEVRAMKDILDILILKDSDAMRLYIAQLKTK